MPPRSKVTKRDTRALSSAFLGVPLHITQCFTWNTEAMRLQGIWNPKADAERYNWDILLCRLHCSYHFKPTLLTVLGMCFAMTWEPAHSHAAGVSLLRGEIPSQGPELFTKAGSSSFLWAGIACLWMLNWISPLKEPPSRLKMQLCPVVVPRTALPGSQACLCKTQEIVPMQHINLKYLGRAITNVLISAH